MDYYLVDYENVRADGIKNLKGVNKGDSITVFYSDACKNITLDVIDGILQAGLQYSGCKVKAGTKNALDFQLCTHLGFLIGRKSSNSRYFILSKDKGYDCVCGYWNDLGISVKRISSFSEVSSAKDPSQTGNIKKTADMASLEEIENLLSKGENPAEVLKIFNQYKTRVAINNGLIKLFKDTKKAGAVYNKIKPLLKLKNKS
jgi:hypothetical protein